MKVKKKLRELIDFYMENAKIMKNKLQKLQDLKFMVEKMHHIFGLKFQINMTSWDFFDYLLEKAKL